MHPACSYLGFALFFGISANLLHARFSLHWYIILVIATVIGLLGTVVVPEILDIIYGISSLEVGDWVQKFVASLWYYTKWGFFIWVIMSWGAMTIALRNPFFFKPGVLAPDEIKHVYTIVSYTGLAVSGGICVAIFISEFFQSVILSRLLPILVTLGAVLIEQKNLGIPLWSFLPIVLLYPAVLIPQAGGACTAVGLREKHMRIY